MNSLQARLNEEFADVSLNIEASQIISAYKKQKKRTVSAFALSSLCAVILLTVINLNTGVLTEFARTTGELLSSYFASGQTEILGETSEPQSQTSPTNPTDSNSAAAITASGIDSESSQPASSSFTASTSEIDTEAKKATESTEASLPQARETDPETQPDTEPETEPKYSPGGDFKYRTLTDGTIAVTGYIGSDEKVNIPKEISDRQVTEISAGAFSENSFIEQLYISKTVKTIGAKAFYNCKKLKSVKLDSVEYIGEQAFCGCDSIEELTVPATAEQICYKAFSDCKGLNTLNLNAEYSTDKNDIFAKGGSNFSSCTSLETVNLGSGVKSIQRYAFYNCTSLKKLNATKNLRIIGASAFAYSGFESLDLPLGLTEIRESAFAYCTKLNSLSLPKSLVAVEDCAFFHCTGLNGVSIPAETSQLGDKCFGYNKKGKISGFEISCYSPSSAKTYALRRGFKIINLGDNPYPTNVTLDKYVITLSQGQSYKIDYEVDTPVGDTTFSTDNPEIASVSSDGVVTAVGSGTAKVTVTNNGVSKTLVVIVK